MLADFSGAVWHDGRMDESRSEVAYRWVVRALYVVAMGINVVYLLEHYQDTPEVQRAMGRVRKVEAWARRPFVRAREWRRGRTEVLLEAWRTVEEARDGTSEG